MAVSFLHCIFFFIDVREFFSHIILLYGISSAFKLKHNRAIIVSDNFSKTIENNLLFELFSFSHFARKASFFFGTLK